MVHTKLRALELVISPACGASPRSTKPSVPRCRWPELRSWTATHRSGRGDSATPTAAVAGYGGGLWSILADLLRCCKLLFPQSVDRFANPFTLKLANAGQRIPCPAVGRRSRCSANSLPRRAGSARSVCQTGFHPTPLCERRGSLVHQIDLPSETQTDAGAVPEFPQSGCDAVNAYGNQLLVTFLTQASRLAQATTPDAAGRPGDRRSAPFVNWLGLDDRLCI